VITINLSPLQANFALAVFSLLIVGSMAFTVWAIHVSRILRAQAADEHVKRIIRMFAQEFGACIDTFGDQVGDVEGRVLELRQSTDVLARKLTNEQVDRAINDRAMLIAQNRIAEVEKQRADERLKFKQMEKLLRGFAGGQAELAQVVADGLPSFLGDELNGLIRGACGQRGIRVPKSPAVGQQSR
jgi:hypothetical protein